jgi:hypothetical protein
MKFLTALIISKYKSRQKYSQEHDDQLGPHGWAGLLRQCTEVLHVRHHQRRQSLLVRLASLAWAHFESVERHLDIQRRVWGVKPMLCVTDAGYEWGFAASRMGAIDAYVNRVLERGWTEQRYELEVRMTKPARTGDCLAASEIKSMLEKAWSAYADWQQDDDLDAVWHGADLNELSELIGDVIDGYCMARGHEWSHPFVPDGPIVESVVVHIDVESKSWHLVNSNEDNEQ